MGEGAGAAGQPLGGEPGVCPALAGWLRLREGGHRPSSILETFLNYPWLETRGQRGPGWLLSPGPLPTASPCSPSGGALQLKGTTRAPTTPSAEDEARAQRGAPHLALPFFLASPATCCVRAVPSRPQKPEFLLPKPRGLASFFTFTGVGGGGWLLPHPPILVPRRESPLQMNVHTLRQAQLHNLCRNY